MACGREGRQRGDVPEGTGYPQPLLTLASQPWTQRLQPAVPHDILGPPVPFPKGYSSCFWCCSLTPLFAHVLLNTRPKETFKDSQGQHI